LDAANAVIAKNSSRMGKNLWTENPKGGGILYFRAQDDRSEALYVADTVLREVKTGKHYRDFAVLYRMNAQSRSLEEILFKNGLPYRIYGGIRFYERKEVKDTLAYLRVILNPSDDISLKRVINVPKRGIGDTTVAKLEYFAKDNGITLFEAARNAKEIIKNARSGNVLRFVEIIDYFYIRSKEPDFSISEFIQTVASESGLLDELRAERETEGADIDRVKNVMELVNKAAEFEQSGDREDKSLAAFLEEVALVADIDGYDESDDFIVLMTMHSAKGLEFNQVFIVGVEETIFPGWRAVSSEDKKEI
jgi:DNA helicase-2/ATP-dependent DNA helicase PcrA